MIINSATHEVTKYGNAHVVRATVKATAKVFDFFANTVYANKFEAICRELTANAIDAHTAAGTPERPVEVCLPTAFDPIFKFRDYGIGMSHEFMTTKFMSYSDGSTKEESNEQIGGFGVGSKSPFAHTDQFTIRSVHEGVLSTYVVFRDEDRCPSLMTLSQESTDEHNGVEVSFPVVEKDIPSFTQAALKALAYFNPLPILHGTDAPLAPPDWVAKGNGWAMRKAAGPLNIVMGGIAYPVSPTYAVRNAIGYANVAGQLLGYGIDIFAPIGSCSVALSREALSLDDATLAELARLVNATATEIVASMATIFDHHPTRWEASADLYMQTVDTGGPRSELLKKAARYKGSDLEPHIRFEADGWQERYIPSNIRIRNRRHSCVPSVTASRFEAAGGLANPAKDVVYIDDLPLGPKSRVTARLEMLERDVNIRVFRRQSGVSLKQLLAAMGNPPYTLLSTVEPPEIFRRDRSADGKRVRPKVQAYRLTQPNSGARNRVPRGNFLPVTAPESGIFVEMINFTANFERFSGIFQTELVSCEHVHWLNKGDADKLDRSNWVSLEAIFAERLAEKLANDPELPQRLAVGEDEALAGITSLMSGLKIPTDKAATPLGQAAKWEAYTGRRTRDDYNFRKVVTAVNPKDFDGKKLLENIRTQQPLVWAVLQLRGDYADKQLLLNKVI